MSPLRKRQRTIVLNLNEQEWDDLLSCITFTQFKHPKDSPNFLTAVEKLRVKMWKFHEVQSKRWRQKDSA